MRRIAFILFGSLLVTSSAWTQTAEKPAAPREESTKNDAVDKSAKSSTNDKSAEQTGLTNWKPASKRSVSESLQVTRPYLRGMNASEMLDLGQELAQRGEREAAERLFATWRLTDADYARLVSELVKRGHADIARLLLDNWQRRFPSSKEAPMLQGIVYHALGELPLAERSFLQARGLLGARPSPADPAAKSDAKDAINPVELIEFHNRLIRFAESRLSIDVDKNPWSVAFAPIGGEIPIGKIASSEASKLPGNAIDLLFEVLSTMPTRGDLWALQGLLLNAAGDLESALDCFQRAEALRYSRPTMIQFRIGLEKHLRATSANAVAMSANAGISQPLAGKTTGTSDASKAKSSALLELTAWNITVILLLGVVLGGLIILQGLRLFRRPTRK